jgi:hypothetical protein
MPGWQPQLGLGTGDAVSAKKTPTLCFFALPADFARQGLNGSWTQPIEINQYCNLSQRRIIATGNVAFQQH